MTTSETVAKQQSTTSVPIDYTYLLILDFEATCNESKRPNPQEIIEFPTLLYNIQSREVEDVFHFYIKPDVHSELSEFCTNLTGITQDQIDNDGIPLKDALRRHEVWLEEHSLISNCNDEENGNDYDHEVNHSFVYLTCGDWDLKTCLPRQLEHMNEKVPNHFNRWMDIKKEFKNVFGKKPRGMVEMLREVGLELEGRHHSGIDDCHNIARICTEMLEHGWIPRSV